MGAWGHKAFENDNASDWVWELEESADHSVLHAALDSIVHAKAGCLESPECEAALGAAEVVAALSGRPAAEQPPEVTAWIDGKPKPTIVLVQKAAAAVDAILQDSELKDLWAETDDSAAWESSVRGLRLRLE